jgi:hypothetical protein
VPAARATHMTAAACQKSPSCVYSTAAGKNQHALRASLPPGDYTVLIYGTHPPYSCLRRRN